MASEPLTIFAAPKPGQQIKHDDKTYSTIKEGRAFILVPPHARTSVDPQAKTKADDGTQGQSVFYNPIQQFNRDLSVLAIKAFSEDLCARKTRKHDLLKDKSKRKAERKRKIERDEAPQENGVESHKRKRDNAEVEDQSRDGGMGVSSFNGAEPQIQVTSPAPNEDVPLEASSDQLVSRQTGEGKVQMQMEGGDTDPQPQWTPGFRILDALSATGLRALRYASEIPFATSVVANDMDKNAVNSIRMNVKYNKLTSAIEAFAGDAMAHMYRVAFPPETSHGPNHQSKKYDVIDLDPYGTAVPFLDAALQALTDGGMLCVTCTDSAVWASCGYSEKTLSLYGGMPIKGFHSHEGGLRLILHSIATSAAKYGLAIEPLLSLSIDFYSRVFVRVRKSPGDVKFLAGKTMLVYGCDFGCGAWSLQPLGRHNPLKTNETAWKYMIAQAPSTGQSCPHCNSKTHVAGPMWGGPIHNPAFIEKVMLDLEDCDEEIYQTKKRIEGMLDTALDELSVDVTMAPKPSTSPADENLIPNMPPEIVDHHPFYFLPSALCKVLKAQAPNEAQLKGAFRQLGYIVTRTHCKPGSMKTNAPWTVIWEVMREWVRQKSPIKEGALKEAQAGFKILQAMRKSETAVDEPTNATPSGPEQGSANEPGSPTLALQLDVKKLKIVFDERLGHDKAGKRLVRYQQNPRENWGPMARAKGSG